MAAGRTGSFTFTDGWGSAKLSWVETYDIASNTSDVTFTLQFRIVNDDGYWNMTYYNNGSLVAGGSTLYSYTGQNAVFLASRYNWYTPTPDSSWTRSGIAHNADGTGTLSVTFDSTLETDYASFTKPHFHGEPTITLTTIPRASTATCTGGTIGQPATITINSAAETFKHSLRFRFPGEGSNRIVYDTGGTAQTQISATSVQWQLDASQITDAYTAVGSTGKSVTVTVYCYTYDASGTSVGSATTSTCQLNIDEASSAPTGSIALTISNPHTSLTGSSSTVILNADTVTATVTAAAKNGASIAKVTLANGAVSVDDTSSPYRTTFSQPTSYVFKYFVYDSRGLKTQSNAQPTHVNYQYPAVTCNGGIIAADTGNVTVTAKGSWWSGNFGAANNAITVRLRYREVGGSWSWITTTTTTSGGTFSASGSLTGLDVSKDYQVQARIQDSLQNEDNVYTYSAVVALISEPIFDWGKRDFRVNGVFRMAGGAQWEGTAAQAASFFTSIGAVQYLSVTASTVASQTYSEVPVTGITTSSRALVQRRYSGNGAPSGTYPICCGVNKDGKLRIYWDHTPTSSGTSIACDVLIIY